MKRLPWALKDKPKLLFGHLHEDLQIESQLLQESATTGRVLCIGGSGCQAFSLLENDVDEVITVDANPAQIEWVQAKIDLIKQHEPAAAAEQLVDEMAFEGLIEKRLKWLNRRVRPLVVSSRAVEAFIQAKDLTAQQEVFANQWQTWRWKFSWKFLHTFVAMTYRSGFMRALPSDWIERMKQRFEACATQHLARENPWMLATLGEGFGDQPPSPYTQQGLARIKNRLGRIKLGNKPIQECLVGETYDLISLSNIADTMKADEITELLHLCAKALSPDGRVVLRSMFWATDEVQDLCGTLAIDSNQTKTLKSIDRSPLCPVIAIYSLV